MPSTVTVPSASSSFYARSENGSSASKAPAPQTRPDVRGRVASGSRPPDELNKAVSLSGAVEWSPPPMQASCGHGRRHRHDERKRSSQYARARRRARSGTCARCMVEVVDAHEPGDGLAAVALLPDRAPRARRRLDGHAQAAPSSVGDDRLASLRAATASRFELDSGGMGAPSSMPIEAASTRGRPPRRNRRHPARSARTSRCARAFPPGT